MRPKIFYVIDNLEFGGGERGFAQLARGLKDRYEIRFACAPGGHLAARLSGMGVPLRPVDFRGQVSLTRLARLAALMRRERVHVVHSMGARADFAARIAGRLAGVPVVVSTIAMFVDGYEVPPLRRALYRAGTWLTEPLCDGFIAVSDSVGKTLVERHRIPQGKVVRIYNGVEPEAFGPRRDAFELKRELGLDPEAPVVGTIGRLVPQKAHDVFLRAASRVADAVPGIQFLVVGAGPLEPRLTRLAAELELRRCVFAGFRVDVFDVLSIMDVFVLASILEGLPRVLLESLAMARPVVATAIDGVREVIDDGVTGLVVPPRDPAALAAATVRLLTDRWLARRLGEAGRKLVGDRFAVGRMVEDVDRFYAALLRAKRVPF